jgi:hypothetical protein
MAKKMLEMPARFSQRDLRWRDYEIAEGVTIGECGRLVACLSMIFRGFWGLIF